MNQSIPSLILSIMCLIGIMSHSQINEINNLPEIMPSSPKTFEFMKYGDIPVSKYTGIPSISIPLFNIDAKGLNIPVSLNYQSNGFKVNEESGSTGLGWTMNTNWSIVQTVNGFDDYGSLLQNRTMPDFANIINVECLPLGNEYCSAVGNPTVTHCDEFILMLNRIPYNFPPEINTDYLFGNPNYISTLITGQKDFQPDIFTFNLPGYSGKFLIDWSNNNYVCLTDNKIKITPVNYTSSLSAPTNFAISVPEGHVYTFSIKEETTIISNYSQTLYHPNSPSSIAPSIAGNITSRVYQLTQIVTNRGENINFEYITTNPIKNFPGVSQSKVRYKSQIGFHPFPNEMSDLFTSYFYTEQPYSYLKKITFNEGVLFFNYSDRIDQLGSKKLDNIELRKDINIFSPILKKFEFNYDYFIGHELGTNTDFYLSQTNLVNKTPQELTHRLKLVSLNELGANPYVFDYNNEQLPKKTSLSKDYWGIYNGYLNNNSSFVDIYKFNIAREDGWFFEDRDNINSSNLQYAKAALLNKITYPTGGSSVFNYELNSFDNVKIPDLTQGIKSFVNISTPTNQQNQLPRKIVIIEGGNTIFKGGSFLSTRGCLPNDPEACNRTFFKVSHFDKTLLTYIENDPVLSGNYNSYGINYVLTVDLGFFNNPPSNQALYNQYYNFENSSIIRKTCDYNLQEEIISNLTFNLPEGIAVFEVSGGCGTYNGTVNSSQAGANLTYNDYKPLTNSLSYGAGVRIKSILNFNKEGDLATSKKFTYIGGKLMTPPHFFNKLYISNYSYTGLGGAHNSAAGYKTTLNTNNYIPLSNPNGKFVGYDSVIEENIMPHPGWEASTNGKIIEYYENHPTEISGPVSIELGLTKKNNYPENGLVKKQEIYNKQDVLLKEINNTYQLNKLECFYGMNLIFKTQHNFAHNNIVGYYKKYYVGVKPNSVTYTSLLSSVTKDYFDSSSLDVINEYEYNGYNQNIYTKTYVSNNDHIIETFNLYPKDFSSESNYMAFQMANMNILSPLISRQVKKNNETIFQEEYEYVYKLGSNSNPFLPDIYTLNRYKNAKGNEALETKIIYSKYDGDTFNPLINPVEVSKKDGPSIVYIWGYNGQYPIAKIENITFDEISSYVQNLKNLSNQDNDRTIAYNGSEGTLRQALDNLRLNLPNSMVTTFTYDPLIGVTSITDPRGYTSYFEYDDFNRLKHVIDEQGNILSENEYNYANQN